MLIANVLGHFYMHVGFQTVICTEKSLKPRLGGQRVLTRKIFSSEPQPRPKTMIYPQRFTTVHGPRNFGEREGRGGGGFSSDTVCVWGGGGAENLFSQ